MPTNPYFNQVTFATEQNLINDLIVESIQIYGHSAYYLRREDVNIDPLFYEDPLARYRNAAEIELYLKNNMSFAGSSEVFSKFGLVIEDQATFLVSATRFANVEPTLSRPRENDIIYIQFTPSNRYLFEIRFVENKEQLFQLGRLYTYELRCEMMNYSHERVETGNTDIDDLATSQEYKLLLTVRTAGGNGDYLVGEHVSQGLHASGDVVLWEHDYGTALLELKNIVGTFIANTLVTGANSGATYFTVSDSSAVANTSPTGSDPVSDNDTATDLGLTIVSPRSNPRYN